ncbi:MAG: hypothetical protein M1602_01410, partial [Firmicutes bacterium]|nr:hypothetical protein [Bacillota bacterium]
PFYLPTLWLARYYLLAGREEEADRLVDLCLAYATDLALMAEHFEPATARQWGNFPQLFSHEELVRTLLLRQQLRRTGRAVEEEDPAISASWRDGGSRAGAV